jgi:hypothetical protein
MAAQLLTSQLGSKARNHQSSEQSHPVPSCNLHSAAAAHAGRTVSTQWPGLLAAQMATLISNELGYSAGLLAYLLGCKIVQVYMLLWMLLILRYQLPKLAAI